jgi:hypothetical protein
VAILRIPDQSEENVRGEHPPQIALACFGTFRQLLVLKHHVRQVLSNGGHRCVMRQHAHAGGLPAIIFAGHRWSVQRSYFHGGESSIFLGCARVILQ